MSLKWLQLVSMAAALGVSAPLVEAKEKDKHRGRGHQHEDRDHKVRRGGLDRNRDGVITRSEWRGNSQSFRVQDRNRDGVLSGLDRVAYRPGTGIHQWDGNRDGVVSYREWRGHRGQFDVLDTNDDGVLTTWELRRF